jgi:hypothetical protein
VLPATSSGVCIASRCGNFANKLLTEITHAEWLKRVETTPSIRPDRMAEKRRKRPSNDRYARGLSDYAWPSE